MAYDQKMDFSGTWVLRNGKKVVVDINPMDDNWAAYYTEEGEPGKTIYFDNFGNAVSGNPQLDLVERLSNRAGKMK